VSGLKPSHFPTVAAVLVLITGRDPQSDWRELACSLVPGAGSRPALRQALVWELWYRRGEPDSVVVREVLTWQRDCG
jgi:hypothetical protein